MLMGHLRNAEDAVSPQQKVFNLVLLQLCLQDRTVDQLRMG